MWTIAWLLYACLIIASGVYHTDFVMHSHWEFVRWLPPLAEVRTYGFWQDLAVNVLLYIPFGLLFLQSRRHVTGRTVLLTVGMGLLLSCGVELYQLYSHNRRPAPSDIVCNVTGTWLGVRAFRNRWRPNRDA
ncbi:MAG: VanZ family protein [Nitrospiraceae bacterium]|nr:VanZ family protein [Nitrospiraceae bacterium]